MRGAGGARVKCNNPLTKRGARPLRAARSTMLRSIKILAPILLIAAVCAGCAQGGANAGAGTGSIEMYGTIDRGVTIRN
ncbi:hypothetical protein [Burkholderia singularis]|nr:hypothetical protein [Burkholderia singularis]